MKKTIPPFSGPVRKYAIQRITSAFLALALLLGPFSVPSRTVQAAVPSGYSEYYIPGSSDQLFAIFKDIDNVPDLSNDPNTDGDNQNDSNQMHTIISLALTSDNITVYYDHWENGYGNGSSNIDETYTGNTGQVMIFESGDIAIPRAPANRCTSKNPIQATLGSNRPCYDGRDRIYVAGGAVTVSTTSWPEVTDTVFAQGYEIYPVKPYMTSYTVPIGQNLAGNPLNYVDFSKSYIMVQAAEDGTNVVIDDPLVGGIQVSTTLPRGGVTQYHHNNSGTTITANKPIQVQLVVGQAHTTTTVTSESRDYTLVPSGLWDTAYYNPVPSFTQYLTEIYIYNPTASGLAIVYEDSSGSGTITVPAQSTRSFSDLALHDLPVGSALYLEAADGVTPFWAIASAGTLNSTTSANANYDYGFSLVPASILKEDYYLSWAPGSNEQTPTVNGSPAFVTPTEDDTMVFVDYSPINGTVDISYTLDRLEVQKIFDPDDDNTGMHIWATAPIAVVWGEDPDTAGVSNPYIDTGYSSLPLPEEWMDVVLTLDKSANPEVISPGAGQISTFTLQVETENFSANDVRVVDNLPPSWEYVPGSTVISLPNSSQISGTAANPAIIGQELTWGAAAEGLVDMAENQTLIIVFQGRTTGTPAQGYSINEAHVSGTRGTEIFEASDTTTVSLSNLLVNKTSSGGGQVQPGDIIDYSISITNNGSILHTQVATHDPLPAGTNYIANSTRVTGFQEVVYSDDFSSGGYNGAGISSLAWGTDWQETDADGGGATGGNIQVGTSANCPSGQCLSFELEDTGDAIYRQANLAIANCAAPATVTLNYDYNNRLTGRSDNLRVRINAGFVSRTLKSYTRSNRGAGTESFTLNPTEIAGNTRIYLERMGDNDNNFIYFDNFRLACNRQITKDNLAGGANPDLISGVPPTLVAAGDNFILKPNQTMSITYRLQVNNPLTAGISQISNTAYVTTLQNPTPLQPSITDALPRSVIGDQIWLDTDGDGVVDAGEPGLANVSLSLYAPGTDGLPGTADDTFIATTNSDATGQYTFSVPAGSYFVGLTGGLPAGLSLALGGVNPTAVFVTAAGQSYLQADFGYRNENASLGIIGDTVWADADGDGLQDPGEPGLPGVTVELRSAGADSSLGTIDDIVESTATTSANGRYLFTGITPGEYAVFVTDSSGILSGYTPTHGPHSTGSRSSPPLTVKPGETSLNVDFGFQPPAGQNNIVGDRLWHDHNGNGLLDSGEPGLAGVTVSLVDSNNNLLATTLTTADGSYSFSGVRDGSYSVWVSNSGGKLAGFWQTYDPDQTGVCTTCDGRDTAISLDPASTNGSPIAYIGADFGYYRPGAIGDAVYSDANGNGVQDPGEPGLNGATVRLYRSDGDSAFEAGTQDVLVNTRATTAGGEYLFTGLSAGTYWVSAVDPAGYNNTTTDADTSSGATTELLVTIPAGNGNLSIDFGYHNTSLYTLGDTVWLDANANGRQDTGESGIPGVTLALYADSNGNGALDSGEARLAATTTGANGNYSFSGLPNGNYIVAVTDQNRFLAGYTNTAGMDRRSVTISGANNLDLDFGYDRAIETAVIGDSIWYDTNADGVQDVTEAGIANVAVSLYADTDGDGDGDVLVSQVSTGSNGSYRFDRLPAGKYIVSVNDSNFNPGGALAGTTSTSGGNTHAPIDLSRDEDYLKADFGYRGNAYILGDLVWLDADQDGLQDPGEPGISDVTVELLNEAGSVIATTITRPDGAYSFSGLAGGSYQVQLSAANFSSGGALENHIPTHGPQAVGGRISSRTTLTGSDPGYIDLDFGYYAAGLGEIGGSVWLDKNMDGVQDAGEPGITEVTLDLVWDQNGNGLRDSGEPVIASNFTDAAGGYRFSGLDLDDGGGNAAYLVLVTDARSALQGLSLTTSANPLPVTLTPAAPSQLNIDFGFDDPILGDLIWFDQDGNGRQDPGESGIQGIEVILYLDSNSNGSIDPGSDNLIRTTTTNANGAYFFSGLPFDKFIIKVTDRNFQTGGMLQGFTASPPNAYPDEVDSDGNVTTHEIAITPLTAKDFTLDFGFMASTGYSIGNLIWEDANENGIYQSGSENGIDGVTVDLYRNLNANQTLDASDLRLGTTTTASGGQYVFSNLPDGSYLVQVSDRAHRLVDYVWIDGADDIDDNSQTPIYVVTINGAAVSYADSGYWRRPEATTAVTMGGFYLERAETGVNVSWLTALELDMFGFNLYRSTREDGERIKLDLELIECLTSGEVGGAYYEFLDADAPPGQTYFYWLEVIDVDGSTLLGPWWIGAPTNLYLPLVVY